VIVIILRLSPTSLLPKLGCRRVDLHRLYFVMVYNFGVPALLPGAVLLGLALALLRNELWIFIPSFPLLTLKLIVTPVAIVDKGLVFYGLRVGIPR